MFGLIGEKLSMVGKGAYQVRFKQSGVQDDTQHYPQTQNHVPMCVEVYQ